MSLGAVAVSDGPAPPQDRSASFAVDSLTVRYGAIEALSSVSLHVDRGETVALVGANGAGKSSLLNAIVGLVPTAGGEVRLGDTCLTGQRPERIVRCGVALAPEGRRVFPAMSVADNLRLGGVALRSQHDREETLAYVLDLFPRLRERLAQTAGTLSGGEQQMLALGRALASRPTVLLLDEPSLGLAPVVVDQIFSLISRLGDEGITMLIVEQNVRRTLEVADRAYVLVRGRIERETPAAELLASGDLERLYLGRAVT